MQQTTLCLWAPLHSHPLGPSVRTAVLWASLPAQLSHTAILWASVLCAATTPASALLSCSLAAVTLCHANSTWRSSTAMYCPQVCSELVSQGQMKILATGSLLLSTVGLVSYQFIEFIFSSNRSLVELGGKLEF